MPTPSQRQNETSLDQASIGEKLLVTRVRPSPIASEWDRWLGEIGFFPGERVELMAKAIPGGDPLVIRVGQSTFALRCAEAACIDVIPHETTAATQTQTLAMEGSGA
ncbi:FeoA family protein [Propionivibrio dicarboxylicus]|uniref:Ferrous iron transport protein A n=1 Tax=Propionivibrio dicarboxylicus TaxID=83767 RepID=A0A1G8K8C9_9RHOO|nr:FeoA family protein [Propionivibrio dicarboxylicus]SDI39682.1 ferrous iron transport protein A [Propionivibrio dicarboxylicus]